jgi:c-di-GMP-binding flagellar brake protein YcgR
MIKEKREFQRFDVKQQVYVYHGVSKYAGRLENLSCGGALVEVATLPELIEPGDTCHLAFASNPDAILCPCTVVRVNSFTIGLRFLDIQANA